MKDFRKDWTKNQRNHFFQKKGDYLNLFQEYGVDITELLNSIDTLDNNKFHNVNYAFAKLSSALRVCNFLIHVQVDENHDTDKIIITTLVSFAEVVYRLVKPNETVNDVLVKGYFRPLRDKLKFKIKSSFKGDEGEVFVKESFDYAETLYYIRNDYIHNGNFLGRFFLDDNTKYEIPYCYNHTMFRFTKKDIKNKLLIAYSECNLTYGEFLSIFLECFKSVIEKYISK